MELAGEPESVPAEGDLDDRLVWVGPDDRGVVLEVIAVDLSGLPAGHPRHAASVPEDLMATKKTRYEPAPDPDVDLQREDIRDRRGRRIT